MSTMSTIPDNPKDALQGAGHKWDEERRFKGTRGVTPGGIPWRDGQARRYDAMKERAQTVFRENLQTAVADGPLSMESVMESVRERLRSEGIDVDAEMKW